MKETGQTLAKVTVTYSTAQQHSFITTCASQAGSSSIIDSLRNETLVHMTSPLHSCWINSWIVTCDPPPAPKVGLRTQPLWLLLISRCSQLGRRWGCDWVVEISGIIGGNRSSTGGNWLSRETASLSIDLLLVMLRPVQYA